MCACDQSIRRSIACRQMAAIVTPVVVKQPFGKTYCALQAFPSMSLPGTTRVCIPVVELPCATSASASANSTKSATTSVATRKCVLVNRVALVTNVWQIFVAVIVPQIMKFKPTLADHKKIPMRRIQVIGLHVVLPMPKQSCDKPPSQWFLVGKSAIDKSVAINNPKTITWSSLDNDKLFSFAFHFLSTFRTPGNSFVKVDFQSLTITWSTSATSIAICGDYHIRDLA